MTVTKVFAKIAAFLQHACDIKFVGILINVGGRCLSVKTNSRTFYLALEIIIPAIRHMIIILWNYTCYNVVFLNVRFQNCCV